MKITMAWSAAGSARDPQTQNGQRGNGDRRKPKPLSLSVFADYISGHDETDTLPGQSGPVYFSEDSLFPGLLDLLYL